MEQELDGRGAVALYVLVNNNVSRDELVTLDH